MTLAQTITVFVDSNAGNNWLLYVVGGAEVIVGLALALTWLWMRRGKVKLSSSTERSRDRHTLLFTAAGIMAILSGVMVLLGKVNPNDSLIPLAMVGVAALLALIPSNADTNMNDE